MFGVFVWGGFINKSLIYMFLEYVVIHDSFVDGKTFFLIKLAKFVKMHHNLKLITIRNVGIIVCYQAILLYA